MLDPPGESRPAGGAGSRPVRVVGLAGTCRRTLVESAAVERQRAVIGVPASVFAEDHVRAARRPYVAFVDRLLNEGRITSQERAALRREAAKPLIVEEEDPPPQDRES